MRKFIKVLLGLLVVCLVIVTFTAARGDGDVLGDLVRLPGEIAQALGAKDGARRDGLPEVDANSWQLKLVNKDHPLPETFTVTTAVTKDEYLFDSRAVSALDAMLDAGKEAGMKLALTSAYRSWDYQTTLFENKVATLMADSGLGRAAAEQEAGTEVARPGTSEHELGLAADIVCDYYGILDNGYADTPEAQWLDAHCAEYGFILRYPAGKSDITGIIYEPWHFRYVGVEAAKYIMGHGLCLEEFIGKLTGKS